MIAASLPTLQYFFTHAALRKLVSGVRSNLSNLSRSLLRSQTSTTAQETDRDGSYLAIDGGSVGHNSRSDEFGKTDSEGNTYRLQD